MATYFITAVGRTNGNINRFWINQMKNNTLVDGKLVSEQMIKSMVVSNNRDIFYVATWDYGSAKWVFGPLVAPIKFETGAELRSLPDGINKNNLSNLPDIEFIVS